MGARDSQGTTPMGATVDALKAQLGNLFASLLAWLTDGYWPAPDQDDDVAVRIQGPRRLYTLQHLLAVGDAADIHLATAGDDAPTQTPSLLKVPPVPDGHPRPATNPTT